VSAPVEAPRPGFALEVVARRCLLVVAALTLVTGLLAGLARSGIALAWGPSFQPAHGPLIVLGAFGTIIGLERAVALARGWAFAAPAVGAASAIAMLAGTAWAPWPAAASSAALVCVNAAIVRRQSAAFTWLLFAGSAALFAGSLAWALGRPVSEVVLAWIAFFVLTIAGERLELSRLTPTPPWAVRALVALAVVLGAAACSRLAWGSLPTRLAGLTLALIGAWQLRFDVARWTVRQHGLPRFCAVGILLGSAWLVVAGALLAAQSHLPAGLLYDGVLHAVFVGYVVSMVFAHAPIILPAVARLEVPYHRSFWVALLVLHAGLVLRVLGDLAQSGTARQWGGIANVAALLLYAAAVVGARMARRKAHP
jgi:hypothetical protein